jgi:MFS family permease
LRRALRIPARLAFPSLIAVFLAIVSQTAVPSPFYPLYQTSLHLAPIQITIVFAAYVIGIIAALLTVGSLSDFVGRRPPILVGAILMVAADITFLSAHGFTVLIAARVLQGLGIGTANAALAAALTDLAPRGGTRLASILAGALPPAALCLGALWGGLAAQLPTQPEGWAYGVSLTAGVLALVIVLALPETGPRRNGAWRSLRPQMSVPAPARPAFRAVVGALVAGWALIGLYLALMPSVLAEAWPHTGAFLRVVPITAALAAAALAGLALARANDAGAMRVALTALIAGAALVAVALLLRGTPWPLLAPGTVAAGFGFGGAFQSALRHIVAATPPSARAAALAAALTVSFAAFGIPCVIAGALVPAIGINLVAAAYAIVMVLTGVATAIGYRRFRVQTAE